MDHIYINKIRAYGYIGFFPEEKVLGQWFEVNLRLSTDLSTPGKSDRLEDTVNYGEVVTIVQTIISTAKFALIERLAQAIADQVLALDKVTQVQVQVIKEPPIPNFDGQTIIEITRP
ncbi:MAG: dihydroneopterin aldolase [Microcystaceae cyanobacterium]